MYITSTDIKNYSGIDTTLLSGVDDIINSVCGYVDEKTGRKFSVPSPDNDETRYYDGNDKTKIAIDDLRSITSLTVDGVALTKDVDYFLSPANASADNKPYEYIELNQDISGNRNPRANGLYIFEKGQRNVVIVGKFGYYSSVPSVIKMVCLKIATAFLKESTNNKDVASESLGEYSVSYVKVADVANNLGVDEMLKPFIKKSVVGSKPMSGYIQV